VLLWLLTAASIKTGQPQIARRAIELAKMMLEDPSHLGMISLEEDKQMKPVIKKSSSWTC
jgi:hypothetical protein